MYTCIEFDSMKLEVMLVYFKVSCTIYLKELKVYKFLFLAMLPQKFPNKLRGAVSAPSC